MTDIVNDFAEKLTSLQNEYDNVQEKNAELGTQLSTLETSNGELNSKLSDLETTLSSSQSENAALESSNGKLNSKLSDLETALSSSQSENAEIQDANANLTSKVADLANKLSILHEEKESIKNEHANCGEQIANLETALAEAKAAAVKEEKKEPETLLERIAAKSDEIDFGRIGKADESSKDDLKRIKGIGPFIEEKLNVLGIFTFEQLSKLTDDDVDKINKIIEFFPGRAKRDNWVGQAQNIINSSFFS